MKNQLRLSNKEKINAVINANAHTFAYTETTFDEINENHIQTIISIDHPDCQGDLLIFNSIEDLFLDTLNASKLWDPTSGSDDQYYDYNPATLEAIMLALTQVTPEQGNQITEIIIPKLESFLADGTQDEEMLYSYESYLKAIQSKDAPTIINQLCIQNIL